MQKKTNVICARRSAILANFCAHARTKDLIDKLP